METGRGIKRTGKFGSVYLLAVITRSDALVRIHGSAYSQSREEECHQGNGLVLENCSGYHCWVVSFFLLSSKGGCLGNKSKIQAEEWVANSVRVRSVFISFFPGRVLMVEQCVYLRSSKCRGVSEARVKKSIGVN